MSWQAEVFSGDALEGLNLRESVETIPILMETAIATLETAQTNPAVIAAEREVLVDIAANRIALTEYLGSERKAIDEMVACERNILLDETEAMGERLIGRFL
jgi:hypothetical protein